MYFLAYFLKSIVSSEYLNSKYENFEKILKDNINIFHYRLNSSFKTPNSRIPIRTAKAEKRAREQGLIPDVDETQLSPSELRALK